LKKLVLIAIFSLFFILPAVMANVNVKLSTDNMVGYAGEIPSIDLTVNNNGAATDTFSISVWPQQYFGITTNLDKYLVTLDANSQETVGLKFAIAMDAEEITPVFSITAKSITNASVSDTQSFYLTVVRKTNVYIKDIKLEKYTLNPEETATIETTVINIADTPSGKYYLETTIKKTDNIIKKFDDTLEGIAPLSTAQISKSYTFGKYDPPGTYAIQSVLKDSTDKTISSKSTNLEIKVVNKTCDELLSDITKSTKYNFFWITTTLTVKNEGNVATQNCDVTESVPSFIKTLFDPEVEPKSSTQAEGRVVYSWLISAIEPGDKTITKYSFDLWRIWLTVLIVGLIIYGAFKLFYKPTIVKRHSHEGPITRDKEILVSLDVRNRTKHEIRDVEVRDVVPSIARVVEKFDTLAPRTRTSEIGTELRWKIDSLKPREERVLTYRIRPVVEVTGTLNLPEAKVRYVDKKKIKRIIASKSLLIKG
jgi:hypothetical protein